MKKALLILLLLPAFSWGAAITAQQVDEAQRANMKIIEATYQMRELIMIVHPLITNGNTYQLSFSTNTVALTPEQKQDIVDKYQSIKADMEDAFLDLP